MKIFHIENGEKVVYVQLEDLAYLVNETNINIPNSIFLKAFGKNNIIDDNNRFDFVRFDRESEVKFFEELDFIIDYEYYKNLNDEKILSELVRLKREIRELSDIWNVMSEEDRLNNIEIYEEYKEMVHVINSIDLIYGFKNNQVYIPIPKYYAKKSFIKFTKKKKGEI